MEPLVSILIPVHNAEKWVTDTFDSAINQSWKNIEIIFVDDGSTDNSLEILKNFKSEKIKVLSQENKGASSARNLAYKESKGDYIQFLDADDILAHDKIELQLKRLLKEPENSIATCSWARFYNNDLNTANFITYNDHKDYSDPINWILDQFNGCATMPPVAWLIPRRVIEKTGLWNESLSLNDDTEYFVRVLLKSNEILFCKEAKGYYRSGNNTLSARKDLVALNSYFKVCEICEKLILKYENTDRTRRALANLWQFFIYEVYPECLELRTFAKVRISELGGSDLQFPGSPKFKTISRILGWRFTKILQKKYNHIRFNFS